jgi:hypothetical protein
MCIQYKSLGGSSRNPNSCPELILRRQADTAPPSPSPSLNCERLPRRRRAQAPPSPSPSPSLAPVTPSPEPNAAVPEAQRCRLRAGRPPRRRPRAQRRRIRGQRRRLRAGRTGGGELLRGVRGARGPEEEREEHLLPGLLRQHLPALRPRAPPPPPPPGTHTHAHTVCQHPVDRRTPPTRWRGGRRRPPRNFVLVFSGPRAGRPTSSAQAYCVLCELYCSILQCSVGHGRLYLLSRIGPSGWLAGYRLATTY